MANNMRPEPTDSKSEEKIKSHQLTWTDQVIAGMGGSSDRAMFPEIPDIVIEKEIAQGGMGTVYRGRQPYLDRTVAVKVLKAQQLSSVFVERFKREARILARLSHPNIVTCYQAGAMENGNWYIVMEFVEGRNLYDFIREKGPLNERQAVLVVKCLARALGYAYKNGIIHRDIKPENVLFQKVSASASEAALLEDSGFPYAVKLVDLGIARGVVKGDMNVTETSNIIGTPYSMAPEQLTDPDIVDYRADIYGLGCVLYYMLSAEKPFPQHTLPAIIHQKINFEPPDLSKICRHLSERMCNFTRHLLARKREDRPQSYEEIERACSEILKGIAKTGKKPRWLKRIAVAMVLSVAGAILVLTLWYPSPLPAGLAPDTAPRVKPLSIEERGASKEVQDRGETKAPKGFSSPDLSGVQGVEAALPKIGRPTRWSEPKSLFPADYLHRLDQWQERKGAWAPYEDKDEGVVAYGNGRMSYPLPQTPWLIRGTLSPINRDIREFGISMEMPEHALTMRILYLTKSYSVLFENARKNAAETMDSMSIGAGEIVYSITCWGSTLEFDLGEKGPRIFAIEGQPRQLVLYVKGVSQESGVHFKTLQLQLPDVQKTLDKH